MQVGQFNVGLGALIALLVLVINLVLWVVGHPFDRTVGYADVCALALARLVP